MIWRERKGLLIILGGLLLANTIFFFTYRVQYESRLRDLDARLDGAKAQLEQARRTRVGTEQQIAAYKRIDGNVREIYENRWSTEQLRLTAIIAEVKRLAASSNLTPETFSFNRTENKSTDRNATGATVVGIGFNVTGSYQQVRRLINQIELSDQFIIIDQIGLTSAADDKLSVSLHVKTLFRDTAPPRRARNQDL